MLALEFIRTALKQVSIDQVSTPQLQQLYLWMQEQEPALLKSHAHRLRTDNSDWLSKEEKEPSKVLEEIRSNGPEGEALSQVGPALGSILQGSVIAKELLASSLVMTDMTGMSECRNKLKEVRVMSFNLKDVRYGCSWFIQLISSSSLLSQPTTTQHCLSWSWAMAPCEQQNQSYPWITVIFSNTP
jgi:hypothetical protein